MMLPSMDAADRRVLAQVAIIGSAIAVGVLALATVLGLAVRIFEAIV